MAISVRSSFAKNAIISLRRSFLRSTGISAALTPCSWKYASTYPCQFRLTWFSELFAALDDAQFDPRIEAIDASSWPGIAPTSAAGVSPRSHCRSDWRDAIGHEDPETPELSRSGRQFAAWIGLTPKDHPTRGKARLGVITRAGDEALRATLVSGATSLIRQVQQRGSKNASPWLIELLKRKPPKLAAVALANKTARIAWKLMLTGEKYSVKSSPDTLSRAA
jgi:hypothetical protein